MTAESAARPRQRLGGYRLRRVPTRRRVAVATWRPSRDGRIYSRSAIDATAIRAYVEEVRAATGVHVTMTHVVGAALGRAICAVPEVRARVVLGHIHEFPSCDVGFAVDIAGGADLAPVKVLNVNEKSPADIARELSPAAARLRTGRDPGFSLSSSIVRMLPPWSMRPVLAAAGFLIGGLGVPALGQKGSPLGAAFVSNVGPLGLDEAFLAPLPFARVPLYLAIGAVQDAAMVVDGEVVVRPQVVLGATADHRIVDGVHAGQLAIVLRRLLADPWQLDLPWPGTADV